jgi:hypothetical protein
MHPLIWIGLAGGAYYLYSKSSSGNLANQSQSATQANNAALSLQGAQASAAAQQFNSEAQSLGLTQDQAQEAYDTGLSPSEYASGVLGSSSGSASGPLLSYYGQPGPGGW